MEFNLLPIALAGFVPMIIGAIYYGPLLGKAWLNSTHLTEEDITKGNMPLIYGMALIMSMVLSFGINILVELTHGSFANGEFVAGSDHNFLHGAYHGIFLSLFTVIPALVIVSLFHRMSAKNILINVVYWLITISLMAGITDQWN